MRKRIDGTIFNTETALRLGRHEPQSLCAEAALETLYQSPHGTFFLHTQTLDRKGGVNSAQHAERAEQDIRPIGRPEALKWYMQSGVERFPGAGAVFLMSDTVMRSIMLRMPEQIKMRAENAAESADMSLNLWIITAVEEKLDGDS